MTDLATIQAGWDRAAREDAMFNIITDPDRADGRWTPEEFFAHGQREIAAMLDHLDALGLKLGHHRALDFGCGVGRVTQALADHYDHVHGVDISAEMIDRAVSHNTHGNYCLYHVNEAPDLALFKGGMFDLVYSMIVLQHMPAPLAKGYVQEFLRVLAPAGLAVFELPPGPGHSHPNDWLSMHGAARTEVEVWVTDAGGEVVDVEPVNDGSYRYTAVAS